jgi:hypothetical protein
MNFKAELNPDDVARWTRGFDEAAQAQSARTLEHLADAAVRQLRDLDNKLGHHGLAELWEHTDVYQGDGGLEITVFSGAETMTFFNKGWDTSGNRVKSDVHSIQGQQLLEILEGGATRHDIPLSLAKVMALPGSEGRQVFLLPAGRGVTDHPGVKPNNNVQQTAETIEQGLEATGNELAKNISVDMI